MQVFSESKKLTDRINMFRSLGKTVGFVPTMGALHEGHLSLFKLSASQNDITVVSIFVNPTQVNDKNDLQKYPRTPERDMDLAKKAGCDILFMPPPEEIYPEGEGYDLAFEIGYLDQVMEGRHRPGHFKGVAQVVYRLFKIVKPHKAYFGEKDFQQLAVIKKMTTDLKLDVQIIPCPIIREKDGLAMSSRNMLLDYNQRKAAGVINEIIMESIDKQNKLPVSELKQWVKEKINELPALDTEYFEIADEDTLEPLKNWKNSAKPRAFIAVKAGNIRLIDNMKFYS